MIERLAMKFHKLSEQYPLMPEDELSVLVNGMREHGFDARFPIVLHNGEILDGRNRYLASEEAEVDPVYVDLPESEDPKLFVEKANEHRRHLSSEWLQKRRSERIERVKLRRSEGASTRKIANEEGVSQTQVMSDISSSGEHPCSPDTSATENGTYDEKKFANRTRKKVKGRDGKTYQAGRKKKTKDEEKIYDRGTETVNQLYREEKVTAREGARIASLPSQVQEEAASLIFAGHDVAEAVKEAKQIIKEINSPALVDDVGIPVPRGSSEAFSSLVEFREVLSLLRKVSGILSELAKKPGGEHLRKCCQLRENNGKQSFRFDKVFTLTEDVKSVMPYCSFCPYCLAESMANDRKCKVCMGLPYVVKRAFWELPQECKDAIASKVPHES